MDEWEAFEKWLHHRLSSAANQSEEETWPCEDCAYIVANELMPLIAPLLQASHEATLRECAALVCRWCAAGDMLDSRGWHVKKNGIHEECTAKAILAKMNQPAAELECECEEDKCFGPLTGYHCRAEKNCKKLQVASAQPSSEPVAIGDRGFGREGGQPSYVEYRATACHAGSDGDCDWEACPQELNGRSNYQKVCPLLSQPQGKDGKVYLTKSGTPPSSRRWRADERT